MEARARALAPSAALFPVGGWLVEQMPDYKDRKETPRKAGMTCSYYSRYSELAPDSSQKYTPPPCSYPWEAILSSSIVPTRARSAAISKAVLKAVFHHSFSVGFGCHRRSISCRGGHGAQGNLNCSRLSRAPVVDSGRQVDIRIGQVDLQMRRKAGALDLGVGSGINADGQCVARPVHSGAVMIVGDERNFDCAGVRAVWRQVQSHAASGNDEVYLVAGERAGAFGVPAGARSVGRGLR